MKQGKVLYLALEDNYARLQRRLHQMFGTQSTENLYFSVEAKSIREGLEQQLEAFLQTHPDTRLIIIDTLQKIRENGQEGSSYGNDYEIITQLKHFADRTGLCLMLVHHTRKQQSEDSFDMISGTNGLLGAADGAWVLHKKCRSAPEAILEVSGRDQQDRRFRLLRDTDSLQWTMEEDQSDAWEEQEDPLLEQIDLLLAEEDARWQGTSSELAAVLGSGMTSTSITRKLNALAGELYERHRIRYIYVHLRNGRRIQLERVTEPIFGTVFHLIFGSWETRTFRAESTNCIRAIEPHQRRMLVGESKGILGKTASSFCFCRKGFIFPAMRLGS